MPESRDERLREEQAEKQPAPDPDAIVDEVLEELPPPKEQ